MRWILTPVALAISTAATSMGCYASHARIDGRDVGTRVDASVARVDATTIAIDAPLVSPDAWLDPSCSPRPLDVACTDTGTGFVPVGVPYALPVRFGDGSTCFCGEAIACAATVSGRDLLLETRMCADLLCDGCFPYVEGTCALPPLDEGRYRVLVNGAPSFELDASNATPAIGPVDACLRPPVDEHACGWELAPSVLEADELCHPPLARAGEPIAVEVHSFCLPCGSIWGPCTVTRTATSIHVSPTIVSSRCDVDCETDCLDRTTVCTIPPLEPGKYQLSVDGLDQISLFTAGDETREGRVCVSVSED
ncbi:MAG: hypothetical protein J0L92_15890 [Deltaproteobacteria bacterium]|nr:hypothetical protein [Deltaproteobacteria bacterium]